MKKWMDVDASASDGGDTAGSGSGAAGSDCGDSAGAVISYDPNYRATLWENVETAKREMKSLIPFVDVMKISDEETELLTDEKKPEQAAKVLMEKGVKLVAVTLGKDGAYIANAEGGKRVPGFESNVVDTTGAGVMGKLFLSFPVRYENILCVQESLFWL